MTGLIFRGSKWVLWGLLYISYNGSKMTGLIFRGSEGVLWGLLYIIYGFQNDRVDFQRV